MTNQEMFDKAVKGLRSQNYNRCVSEDGGCQYTSDDGKMHCAWGWVDTDLPAEESDYLSGLIHHNKGVAGTLNEDQVGFATRLQQSHDSASGPEDMIFRLKQLAEVYSLDTTELF